MYFFSTELCQRIVYFGKKIAPPPSPPKNDRLFNGNLYLTIDSLSFV